MHVSEGILHVMGETLYSHKVWMDSLTVREGIALTLKSEKKKWQILSSTHCYTGKGIEIINGFPEVLKIWLFLQGKTLTKDIACNGTHFMSSIFLCRYISKIAETSVKVVFLRKGSNTPELLLHLYPCSQQTEITLLSKAQTKITLVENRLWASWLQLFPALKD